MKKIGILIACIFMSAVWGKADLITNGDFEEGGDWKSQYGQSPSGWTSSSAAVYTESEYGEIIDNLDTRPACMMAGIGNYYQQVLSNVNAGSGSTYKVTCDYGARSHSEYNPYVSVGHEYILRFSLWDTTDNVELVGVDQTFGYPGGHNDNFLTPGEYILTYDNSGLYGHELALRITHNTQPPSGAPKSVCTSMIDNVTVDIQNVAKLVSPSPSGMTDLKVETILEWDSPSNFTPTEYRVYFGTTEPNMLFDDYGLTELTADQEPYTSTTITPVQWPLEYLTTYYWVVDSYDNDVRHKGMFWSFTTITANAVLNKDSGPFDLLVAPGDEAVFTVAGENIDVYKWYGPNGLIAGANTNTLTLTDVQADGEGYYYCVVDNTVNPKTEKSREAYLLTERVISHWELEGNLLDSVGENIGSEPGPRYAAEGIVGTISLDVTPNDPNTYVRVSNVDELNNGISFTIEAWIKPENINNYHAIVSNRGGTVETGVDGGYVLYLLSNGGIGFWIHNGIGFNNTTTGGELVTIGEWNYVVAIFDSGTATVYVNGELAASAKDRVIKRNTTTDLYIGAGANDEDQAGFYFDGLIDDVTICSGAALDAYQIAENYVTQFPEADICVEQEGIAYDLDNDCDVDLADFALLVSEWLNCNRVVGENSLLNDCN